MACEKEDVNVPRDAAGCQIGRWRTGTPTLANDGN
jgi:hypothetical protein